MFLVQILHNSPKTRGSQKRKGERTIFQKRIWSKFYIIAQKPKALKVKSCIRSLDISAILKRITDNMLASTAL